VKLLEENLGENALGLWNWQGFLDKTLKAQDPKAKTDKWDYSNLKTPA
jgi:hypothetical protein